MLVADAARRLQVHLRGGLATRVQLVADAQRVEHAKDLVVLEGGHEKVTLQGRGDSQRSTARLAVLEVLAGSGLEHDLR